MHLASQQNGAVSSKGCESLMEDYTQLKESTELHSATKTQRLHQDEDTSMLDSPNSPLAAIELKVHDDDFSQEIQGHVKLGSAAEYQSELMTSAEQSQRNNKQIARQSLLLKQARKQRCNN